MPATTLDDVKLMVRCRVLDHGAGFAERIEQPQRGDCLRA
jgi:hypothetical protein